FLRIVQIAPKRRQNPIHSAGFASFVLTHIDPAAGLIPAAWTLPRLLNSRFLLSALSHDHTLDYQEQAEHSRYGDTGPPSLIQTDGRHDILDQSQGQNTQESSENVAYTAGQQRAADDRGCDGVHLHAGGMRR